MKKITLMVLLLALAFAGCNNKNIEVATDNSDTLNIPEKKYLTEQQLQEQVDKEIKEKLSLVNDEKVEEAIQIINLTESAIKDILDSSYTKASEKLEDAIGKASVLTATRPDLSFFPLDVHITTRDLIADINKSNTKRSRPLNRQRLLTGSTSSVKKFGKRTGNSNTHASGCYLSRCTYSCSKSFGSQQT